MEPTSLRSAAHPRAVGRKKMKLLIFDIDGTLTETSKIDTVCYVEAIKKVLNLDEIDTRWETYTYVTDSGIAEEISQRRRGIPASEDELKEIEKEMVSLFEVRSKKLVNLFAPISGAKEAIDFFKKSEFLGISIATGGWEKSSRLKLNVSGIDVSGIPIATSSDSFERENIMKISLERAKDYYGETTFNEIIYFGDALWDYKASLNLGWRRIGIGKDIKKLMRLGVKSAFKDFHDLGGIQDAIAAQ